MRTLCIYWSKLRTWGLVGAWQAVRRKIASRIVARRLRALAKQCVGTHPVRGVTVVADLSGRAALSKTTRDFILSLREAGIPCQAYDTRLRPQIPAADLEGVVTPAAEFDLRRYSHVVEMYFSPLDHKLLPEFNFAKIAFHETAAGIESTAPYLFDGHSTILAMSDFNFEYYRTAFKTQPVVKIVYPLHLPVPVVASGDKTIFTVFFNFDFGSYHRKNPQAAIRAFALAFASEPKARLVFKTKGASEHRKEVTELERLAVELGVADRFRMIHGYLPQVELDALYGSISAYLSLHRGEGFGIGMAEAMLSGVPVVATDWSANTEFCHSDNSYPVSYRLVPIRKGEYMTEMKEWAEADVDAAAAALREIRDNPEKAAGKAARAESFIRTHFSLESFRRSVDAFLNAEHGLNTHDCEMSCE